MQPKFDKAHTPLRRNALLLFEGLVAVVYFCNGIYHFPSFASIFELIIANLFLLILIFSR